MWAASTTADLRYPEVELKNMAWPTLVANSHASREVAVPQCPYGGLAIPGRRGRLSRSLPAPQLMVPSSRVTGVTLLAGCRDHVPTAKCGVMSGWEAMDRAARDTDALGRCTTTGMVCCCCYFGRAAWFSQLPFSRRIMVSESFGKFRQSVARFYNFYVGFRSSNAMLGMYI